MATTRRKRAEAGLPDRDDGPRTSLLGALLSGLVRSPACGGELGHAREGVAALELVDGVLEVAPGIDAEDEAVVDQGVSHGEAFTTAHGAGEEEISAADGVVVNSPFGSTVVDLERAVAEAATEEEPLVDGVGRRLGQEGGMRAVHPGVKLIQDGQRAQAADLISGRRSPFSRGSSWPRCSGSWTRPGGTTRRRLLLSDEARTQSHDPRPEPPV